MSPVRLGPAKALATLAAMPQQQAQCVLQSASDRLKTSSQLRSLPSVASGLRLWRNFALQLLNYAADRSLLPRSAQDIVQFVSIFRNPGTAANYVGYVKWACVFQGLSLHWHTGQVTMALKGLKKQAEASCEGQLLESKLLDEDTMLKLITLCNKLPEHAAIGDIFLLTWQFLLQGPSEAVPVQWGTENDLRNLPAGRRSALWVSSSGVTYLRLRR